MTGLTKYLDNSAVEKLLVDGDLAALKPDARAAYYLGVCESIGLNPTTRPFQYIRLNGKLTLYATKSCTDQLRTLHGVSIAEPEIKSTEGMFVVTVTAKNADGRTDTDMGAVPIAGMKGEALANAMMKCMTKAKRRVTLSLCGLGMLDETEISTIPNAQAVTIEQVHQEPQETPQSSSAPEPASEAPVTWEPPQADPEDSYTYVQSVTEKQGRNGPYWVVGLDEPTGDQNGLRSERRTVSYNTFSRSIATEAEILMQRRACVRAELVQNGEYTNLHDIKEIVPPAPKQQKIAEDDIPF